MGERSEIRDLPVFVPAPGKSLIYVARKIHVVSKRAADLALAAALIVVLSPLLLLLAAWISMTDGGSAIFRQPRVGRNGRSFMCLKFRTMVPNAQDLLDDVLANDPAAAAEWAEYQKLKVDPRITSLGHFLRQSSLDELPQLFNILLGEMSFVGPRPIVLDEVARYGEAFERCFSVRPGLTGLWQVSGRSDCSYDERVTLDSRYVAEWSILFDLRILVMTVPAVLLRKGGR